MHTANGLRHAEPLDRPQRGTRSPVCRGLYSAVSFCHISPCAFFCRELLSQYTVRPTFALCCSYSRREPFFCRGLESPAHDIIFNAVRRRTANRPHTEKADFPVVITMYYKYPIKEKLQENKRKA
jgi:hypothetical protein